MTRKRITSIILAMVLLLATMPATYISAGELCENPIGGDGTSLCGGSIYTIEYIDWVPFEKRSPCTAHSRYDHMETSMRPGSAYFESCSRCGEARFIPIGDGIDMDGQIKKQCESFKLNKKAG